MSVSGGASAADVWRNPAPYPVGMDTWFGTVYNKTAQHDNRLRVGGDGDMYTTLPRFDLGGLPQVADRAYIWLYPIYDGGSPTNINWSLIGKQWQSGTVGSSDFPLPSNVLFFAGTTIAPTVGQWYRVEITSIYNAWRSSVNYKNYGLYLAPTSNNNNYSSFASSQQGYYGPHLQVSYTPQANDNIIKLKWPLGTAKPATPTVGGAFGDDWNNTYCDGLIKKHNGADYSASAGTEVYAAEDGFIRKRATTSTNNWGGYMTLEHNHPSGKYTTLYWHVSPVSGTAEGDFIPKGMKIATVQDISIYNHPTHFHFGLRKSPYSSPVSFTGGLPQTNCGGYPAFKEYFINPEDTSLILFQ